MTSMASDDIDARVPELLEPLSCSSSCVMNFVAGDWAGSGNWTATNGVDINSDPYVGVYNGTVTRATSSIFHSVKYVGGWSSANYFKVTSDTNFNVNGTDTTYEFVLENLPATASVSWFGYITSGNDGGRWFYTQTTNRLDIEIANTSAGAYLGGISGNNTYTTDKPILITATFKVSPPPGSERGRLYINGTQHTGGVFPDSTTSGAPKNEACALGIGGRWSCNANSLSSPNANIRIVQVLHHSRLMGDSEIATRAEQFNRLKGY